MHLYSLWPVVLCGSQRIAFHHVSSWHKGGSRRPRTFLELRLQTVSLVGNLLTPVTSHVLFRYSELKEQENDTDSSNLFGFFLIINIFPNLIQLFVSSWSDFAQEDATITDRLWNCTTTHTYMLPNNFFLFTCYSTRFFMSLLFLPVLVFNFLSLVTQHKQTQMYQTKRSFQCIKSEIQSLVAMCAPCPLPRLNICLSVIPWWVVAHKKTGQSLYPCPPLSSPSLLSQRINTEDKLTKQLVGACIIMHVRVSVVMCGPQCWLETARHYFWS